MMWVIISVFIGLLCIGLGIVLGNLFFRSAMRQPKGKRVA